MRIGRIEQRADGKVDAILELQKGTAVLGVKAGSLVELERRPYDTAEEGKRWLHSEGAMIEEG